MTYEERKQCIFIIPQGKEINTIYIHVPKKIPFLLTMLYAYTQFFFMLLKIPRVFPSLPLIVKEGRYSERRIIEISVLYFPRAKTDMLTDIGIFHKHWPFKNLFFGFELLPYYDRG